jgi:hypothetical protein
MSICDANCNSKNNFFTIQLNCGHKFHFSCFSGTEYNKHCLNCKKDFFTCKNVDFEIDGYISTKKLFETIIKIKIDKCAYSTCKHFAYPLNKGFCKNHNDINVDDKVIRKLIILSYACSASYFCPKRMYRILDINYKILCNSSKKKYITIDNLNLQEIIYIYRYHINIVTKYNPYIHIENLYKSLNIDYEETLY